MTITDKQKYGKTLQTISVPNTNYLTYSYDGSTFKLNHLNEGTGNRTYRVHLTDVNTGKQPPNSPYNTTSSAGTGIWSVTFTGLSGGSAQMHYRSKGSSSSNWETDREFTLGQTWRAGTWSSF